MSDESVTREMFFLEKAYNGWGIPSFLLAGQSHLTASCCEDGMTVNLTAAEEVRRIWTRTHIPGIWFETDRVFHTGFEDGDGNLYLFGPMALGDLDAEQLQAYTHSHKWKNPEQKIIVLSMKQAVSSLSTLYALVTGRQMREDVILEQNAAATAETGQEENFFKMDDSFFFRYKDEDTYIQILKTGSMKITKDVIIQGMWEIERISPIAKKHFLKQCEYAVVTSITLIRRVAIESGIPEEVCYRKCYEYLERLIYSKTPLEMMFVYADAVNYMSERIQQRIGKRNTGELQEQCKNYIASNIRRKFTITEMSRELGYHPVYLSQFFSHKVGMTLQQYILSERLKLAANLLVNSNAKINEISDYLCFHSPSYLTERFVKQYNMTPTQYRKKNKLR